MKNRKLLRFIDRLLRAVTRGGFDLGYDPDNGALWLGRRRGDLCLGLLPLNAAACDERFAADEARRRTVVLDLDSPQGLTALERLAHLRGIRLRIKRSEFPPDFPESPLVA